MGYKVSNFHVEASWHYSAAAALGLISSQWGEIIMERYIVRHPHTMVGDTLCDTWLAC